MCSVSTLPIHSLGISVYCDPEIAGDPASFIGGQFLPYFIPGFASYFSPQLPGTVQGGYLPPICGMESLFPYGPAVPQTLAGLSPGALLQQYQQYQQSLQDSLQKQQKQQQETLKVATIFHRTLPTLEYKGFFFLCLYFFI